MYIKNAGKCVESVIMVVMITLSAHGSDYGRQSGERLAVCPTGGQLLFAANLLDSAYYIPPVA